MPGMSDLVSGLVARVRSLVHAVRHRDDIDQQLHDEFQHHLAERTDHLVRQGLSHESARQQARREFGHTGTHRAQAREALGLAWLTQLRVSSIDVRLGLRLLVKYPVLNLAAVFALAVGIPVGLAPSHVARALEAPMPGDAANRLRAIRQWDPLASSVASTWASEFAYWEQSLQTFESLGAFRTSSYNLATVDGQATPIAGAQLSASVLPMLSARPLLGRLLEPGDFDAGAPGVVVLGHGLWSSRFGQDPAIVGRSVRIGGEMQTVVGVMPPGFTFPSNESLWLPLRLALSGADAERTRVHVLGRLAEGVSGRQAQVELSSRNPLLSGTTSAVEAEERARLRAEVVPFGLLFVGLPAGGLASLPEYRYVQALSFLLLLVACGNVAMLVFARTATRLREMAIRTSLGASRGRLVSQVFVETLVLSVVAAGVGVLGFDWALDHVNLAGLAGSAALPYWLSLDLTLRTALSALAFAAVSATVAGVVPAIAITGRSISQSIRGGGARMRFGRWSAGLVVADLAVSVAAVGMAFSVARYATDVQVADRATGIPASEYLAVTVHLPADPRHSSGGVAAERNRLAHAAAQQELVAAIEREPGVRRVAVADALPRMEHRSRPYEVDGSDPAPGARLRWVRVARVDPDYLGALETPMLAGRDFAPADAEAGSPVAIVNQAFVDRALGGGDAIGRRVRFPAQPGDASATWHDIVGVVGPLGVNVVDADGIAVYLPAARGTINPMHLAVHATVPPARLLGRMHAIASGVGPDLMVGRVAVLSDVRQGDWYLVMGVAAGLIVLVIVLVGLATSGLYAMLSLSVSERTREIGIRSALGASRPALLLAILKRSLVQVGLGAVIGLPLAARFVLELSGPDGSGWSASQSLGAALALALGIVTLVGLGSCLVPTRRILAVEASEIMRADD